MKKITIFIMLLLFSLVNCKKKENDNTPLAGFLAYLGSSRTASATATGTSTGTLTAEQATNTDGSSRLTAPPQLSLISTSSRATAQVLGAVTRSIVSPEANDISRLYTDATTEYTKDLANQNVFIIDPMASQLSLLSMIFKMANLSGYKWLIGQGPVKVTFTPPTDNSQSGGGGGGQGGSDSAAANQKKTSWIVDAAYTNGAAPLVVKIWGNLEMGGGMVGDLQIKLTVLEPVSDTKPYGKFQLDAAVTASSNGNSIKGGFSTKTVDRTDGKLELVAFESSDATMTMQGQTMTINGEAGLHVVLDKTNDAGQISFTRKSTTTPANPFSPNIDITGYMNFDKNFVFAQVPIQKYTPSTDPNQPGTVTSVKTDIAFDRINTKTVVFRYGLYDKDTGKRVNLQTGFPITSADGTQEGWAGRWGVQFFTNDPTKAPVIADGSTIKEKKFDGTIGSTYTVKVSPGRLIKEIKNTMTTASLKDVLLDSWEQSGLTSTISKVAFDGSKFTRRQTCTAPSAATNWKPVCTATTDTQLTLDYFEFANATMTRFKVAYNGTGWEKVKTCTGDIMTGTCTALTSAVAFTPNSFWKAKFRFSLSGGNGQNQKQITWDPIASPTTVTTYDQVDVDTLPANLTLYYYKNQGTNSPQSECYATANGGTPNITTYETYTVDAATLTLKDSAGNIVTPPANSTNPYSFNKMGLLESKLTFTTGSGTSECGKIWDAEAAVQYNWSTGTESWSKKTRLADSTGAIKIFDFPLYFRYTDPVSGVSEIPYYGFGQLQIPWDDNKENLDNDPMFQFKPRFSIPDATELTTKVPDRTNPTATPTDKTFVVLGLDKAVNMTKVAVTAITAGLSTNPNLAATTKEILVDPALGAVPTPKTNQVCADEGQPLDSNGTALTSSTGALCK